MDPTQSRDAIIENLKDAGCDDATIAGFLSHLDCGQMVLAEKLLRQHRRCLLECLHDDQKRIDCLDYLIYQMKKPPQE